MRIPSFFTMALSSLSLSLLCRCLHCDPVFSVTVFIVSLSSLTLFFVLLFLLSLFTLQSCFQFFHCHPVFIGTLFYCHSIYIVTCFIITLFSLPIFVITSLGNAVLLPLLSCFYLPCFHYHSLLATHSSTLFPRSPCLQAPQC